MSRDHRERHAQTPLDRVQAQPGAPGARRPPEAQYSSPSPSSPSRSEILRSAGATLAIAPAVQYERQYASIPVDMIRVDPLNPRLEIHEWELVERMRSIKSLGLLTPILVRPDDKGEVFHLIAGATRLAACVRLGFDRVDAVVEDMDDAKYEDVRFADNIQRSPLTIYEVYLEVCRRRKKYPRERVEVTSDRTGISEPQLKIFHTIADKVCPTLIAKFARDQRQEILDRLRQASRIEGRNDMERHDAQRQWWETQGRSKHKAKRAPGAELKKRKFFVSVNIVKQIASRVVEQGRIRGTDREWIKIDQKLAKAIENAMLWTKEPGGRVWPEEYI